MCPDNSVVFVYTAPHVL